MAPGDQSLDSAIHQIDLVTLWIVIYPLCRTIDSLDNLGSPAYFFFSVGKGKTTDNSQSFDVWRSGNSQGVAVGRGMSVGGGVGQKLLVADFRGFK